MLVLIATSNDFMSASIKMMLRKENFICDTTDLGEDGLEIGKLYDYDIILLDLMLPDIDGYEVLRRLRAARVHTPILILSGLAELDHKLKGLGFGADDFLTKPFDRRELVARIHAIVRRSKGHAESVIRTGKLVVNLDARVVEVDNRPLHLTGKEYGILELLSLRKGTTLTKEMFLFHLYGGVDEPGHKIIDVFMFASYAKSWLRPPAENTISSRCGDGAMCCATRRSRWGPPPPWLRGRPRTALSLATTARRLRSDLSIRRKPTAGPRTLPGRASC